MKPFQFKKPKKGIWHDQPATKWEEGFVTGNGLMGLIAFGGPIKETLIGNYAHLFLPMGNQFKVPDLSEELSELRKVIKEQGYEKAISYHYQKAVEKGYPGLTMSDPYHPAFHLTIDTGVTKVENYRKSLDYRTGQIMTSYQGDGVRYQSRAFVSRADNLIVYQIRKEKSPLELIIEPEIYQVPQLKGDRYDQNHTFRLEYQYTYAEGGYTVIGEIFPKGGIINHTKQGIQISQTDEVTIIIRIEPILTKQSLELSFNGYEDLFEAHKAIHQEMFDRVCLNLTNDHEREQSFSALMTQAQNSDSLPKALIEKIYDAGRFMYICSSGEATPNLQGIWSGTFHPAWSGDYTFDTNVQLSIASALSSHLEEGLHGFFKLVQSLLPGFRENAKHYYGCRGIMASIHSSNYGQHLHWNEEWPLHFWTCGAGWLGHWFFQYYRFTGDIQFLKEQALPYLEEVALFYEDFLIEDPDGTYRFTPSYSAENGCADNATQDVAVAKEVFTHLIEGYQILKIDSDKPNKWKRMLSKLPAYQINDQGALKEWLTPDKDENYNHRHFSHLYPIFQSREFTAETNPTLFKASRIAFEKRLEAWLLNEDGDTTSTHGRMHTALCATQFHMPELIKEIIMLVIKNNCFYPSLMMSHYNNLEVFNVDGNGAFPQIIHEMFVDYHHDTLFLFQALPEDLDSGEITGIRLPDGLKVDQIRWDLSGKFAKITLVSCLTKSLKVSAPLYKHLLINGVPVEQFVIQLKEKQPYVLEVNW
ncbi:glycosyl hydrolase family 95 catalytic domain-containing protein [Amphibacillus sediminis]|uniref:glycosyl hydrolase family 95 catalytic domain-containing protein n=1 Tax=Amphibacillus sediminis TaxID=360185 RepID=UPI00082A64FA|nr:glycoside hydrolase N-terminal domain-containing protein [Amphibacillus sediminis]